MADSQGTKSSFTALHEVLNEQLAGHRRLLALLQQKQEAIRRADIEAVTRCCQQEQDVAQTLARIEQHRRRIVQRICDGHGIELADAKLTMLASLAPEEEQHALHELAAAFTETTTELRRTSTIVRKAAEALNRHLAGLVQTFQSALSQVGVYGNKGTLQRGTAVQCSVDVKS